jgi:hypothetical protein
MSCRGWYGKYGGTHALQVVLRLATLPRLGKSRGSSVIWPREIRTTYNQMSTLDVFRVSILEKNIIDFTLCAGVLTVMLLGIKVMLIRG